MNFLNVVGPKTEEQLPMGHLQEEIDGLTVTIMDVAVPTIWFKAEEYRSSGP